MITILESPTRDLIDYIAIFAPIVLSIVAIGITLYTTIRLPKKRKLTPVLYWDDLMNRFIAAVINGGNAPMVISKVKLYANGMKRQWILGERQCIFEADGSAISIQSGQVYSFVPVKGSIYDIFGYKGHYFDIDESNRDLKVYIEATDVKGKAYKALTPFTIGDIDEKLFYHNNIDGSDVVNKEVNLDLSVVLRDFESQDALTISELKQWITNGNRHTQRKER